MSGYQRWVLAHLRVDGADVRIRYADLVNVERDAGSEPDWECVAYGFDRSAAFPPGPYRLEADRFEGPSLAGDAFLVRSVDGAHVFRGVGALEELDEP